MTSPVVVITAAAHRGGKRIVEALVDDAWDVAMWGLATMRSRVAYVEARGQRATTARGNIADPRSVPFMVDITRETFSTVDAVVHVGADHLAFADDGSDPATEALVAMGAVTIVYLADPEWDATATTAWCRARDVEAVAIDSTLKVHELAPLVRTTLAVSGSA